MEKAYHSTYYKKKTAKSLHAGDYVYVTGTIYTARDAAHKRMDEALDRGEELPMISKIRQFIIWDHLRREKEDRSAQQDRQQQAGWTNMHHAFWIWGLAE